MTWQVTRQNDVSANTALFCFVAVSVAQKTEDKCIPAMVFGERKKGAFV